MRNAAGGLRCRAGLVGATALCLTSSSCMQPGTAGWLTAKLSTAPSQQSQRCSLLLICHQVIQFMQLPATMPSFHTPGALFPRCVCGSLDQLSPCCNIHACPMALSANGLLVISVVTHPVATGCKSRRRKPPAWCTQDLHLGGDTREQAEARKKHSEERQRQAIRQAVLDAEQRVEMRWPYISPCGKVGFTLSFHQTELYAYAALSVVANEPLLCGVVAVCPKSRKLH